MANMIHPLTGSDYISEQAFNAVVDKAKAEVASSISTDIATAITTADIPGAVATAVDAVLDETIDTKVGTAITTADIPGAVAAAITTADIPGAVDDAIALLPLPAVTVGATVPDTPVDGHIWVDTTSGEVVKLYTGTAWVVLTSTPVG